MIPAPVEAVRNLNSATERIYKHTLEVYAESIWPTPSEVKGQKVFAYLLKAAPA